MDGSFDIATAASTSICCVKVMGGVNQGIESGEMPGLSAMFNRVWHPFGFDLRLFAKQWHHRVSKAAQLTLEV
ncbi:MAG TPA: hypothetical protein VHW45_15845 [Candidatus Sulfotelmatobacter sp.]|nr:hypothetical protein [Candidatus Sulfotelmatobacter sp.]